MTRYYGNMGYESAGHLICLRRLTKTVNKSENINK